MKFTMKILPMHEEVFIQFVVYIDNNIIVSSYIHSRAWKLPIDSNNLEKKNKKIWTKALLKSTLISSKIKN